MTMTRLLLYIVFDENKGGACGRAGYGRRRYKAEYVRFLVYAHASCDESIEWLTYLSELYAELADEIHPALELANNTGGKLNRFIESVELHHNEF